MFALEFMKNAYFAGTTVAILCGVLGVFVIARRLAFLGHALSEIGFSGATFGLLLNFSPLNGMLLATVLSAFAAHGLGVQRERSEVATSAVSAAFMGAGVLFLSLSNKNASFATSILFGSIVGISVQNVIQICSISIIVLLIMLLIYRRLKFDSFDAVGASIQYNNTNLISLLFLVIMAVSVSVAAQIVGSLLIFVLLTLPAATAQIFCKSVNKMILFAVIQAILGVWLGLALGYYTSWPVSFFIAIFEASVYLISRIATRNK
ncbi:metal ABC transporter permease [Periweissella ghanensis]|uniref:High-affinity zinc uptake system membrane protein ZnuB n=1 Tax=Periweissella ghanensis TaxID=467997 RepID=A0ABN8BLF5_9LACO|nr:metal ABC transporter permease [Periweissella ghanensis]MCM0600934.1 metal ABC transporter permease [Periweissella ghanensis]CAH0417648.1 High-affinity zinc uptake system membrane protein ZnuB [Periweissella ghanensis]